jgi:hypothetical protein
MVGGCMIGTFDNVWLFGTSLVFSHCQEPPNAWSTIGCMIGVYADYAYVCHMVVKQVFIMHE